MNDIRIPYNENNDEQGTAIASNDNKRIVSEKSSRAEHINKDALKAIQTLQIKIEI